MDERSRRLAARLEIPLLIAALLSLPVLIVEQSSLGEPYDTLAQILNWLIWLAFLGELVAMLIVVPQKWLWLRRNPLDVAIVVLTPPILPPGLQAARFLRLFRLVRLLAVAKYARRVFSLDGLRVAGIVALLTVIAAGASFKVIEQDQNLSLFDGIWWAVGTMTTLGSGIQPTDDAGRILAIAVVLIGIGFVALLTGALAERFVQPEFEEEIEHMEDERGVESDALLDELGHIMERLQDLERRVRSSPGDKA